MRIVDRLASYLAYKGITPYAFERSTDVANGYLNKQLKGKGSIGSEIMLRIYREYRDLDFIWLLTGDGNMLCDATHPDMPHYTKNEMIAVLKARITSLENALNDKEKIIALLQQQRS